MNITKVSYFVVILIVLDMFKRGRKSTFIFTILIVYLANSLLSWSFYMWQKAYAAWWSTDIISVFVDKEIIWNIGNELERFTKSYIARNSDDTQVIVYHIDKKWVSPADMAKINQNLFLEWKKNGPSKLVGTILIWDLKLPMVNKEWFLFPTVYPLVDFDKPKYYYNPNSDYFEYFNEWNSQPEIRHSIINFEGDGAKYKMYFDKLKQYAQDPSKWVAKGLWYEDILHQKQTVNDDNFQKYLNNYVFGEDLMYNRYTNLMVDVYQALHNSGVVEILTWYNDQVSTTLEDDYYEDPEFDEVKSQYNSEIEKFWNLIKLLKSILWWGSASSWDPEPSTSALGALPNSKFINTKFIQKVVDGFIKDYLELYWTSYFDSKENRLSLWWRYIDNSKFKIQNSTWSQSVNWELWTVNWFVNDHITMTSKWDEISKQLMANVNTKMEKALDDKIEQEWYAMNVVVPTRIEIPAVNLLTAAWWPVGLLLWAAWLFKKVKTFEVYYFGLPAEQLQNAEDFWIYRGTFNNIRSLPKLDEFGYQQWTNYNPMQSVWATRGENAREVEAHRWYDFSLIEYDQQEFDRISKSMPFKKIRQRDKTLDKFIWRYRAGYTPLNIDTGSNDLRLNQSRMDYTQLRNPYLDRSIGGWVYDIAWSRITTSDRKIWFTLWTEDEEPGWDEDDDSSAVSNLKSYSWYSDSYLGKDFFGSAIQVSKDDGEWLKFATWLKKYKYRKTGKPRKTDWEELNIWNLTSNDQEDGLFLLPKGKIYTDESDYITIQQAGLPMKRNRYFKSVDSRFFHKSPSPEDLYGSYIPYLENVKPDDDILCDISVDEPEKEGSCIGYQIKFKDLYSSTYNTVLYAKRGEDYFVTWWKVYFNNSAVRYEHGTTISLDWLIWEITWWNKLYIRYNEQDIYLPWWESTFDCELRNVNGESWIGACKGMTFSIQGRLMQPVSDKYINITDNGTRVTFYSGASIMYQWKSINMAWLVAIYDPDTNIATFTGRQLQIWWINEYTLERPIDAPRYVNFQWIWWDKLTRVYPDVWKVPVFKEVENNRVLKSVDEIKTSLKEYLLTKAIEYNNDLTSQFNKRFWYFNGNDGWLARSTWINKFDDYDWSISPLVQTDNTSIDLREYQYLPAKYFVDQLATTWEGKAISSEDMLSIIAQQLYYQNTMWQSLPKDNENKVLNEVSLYQSFGDINNKSSLVIQNYLIQQSTTNLQNPQSLDIKFPYYNNSWYEVAYINSDGSDYVQFETTPPLLKLIQKQKAKQTDGGKKTVEQLDVWKCGSLIPPSYTVSLTKWPQAFKCWLEEVTQNPFELKVSFVGSANWILFSGDKWDIIWDITSQARQARTGYVQSWRNIVKDEDKDIGTTDSRDLHKKLDNLIITYSTRAPNVQSGIVIKIEQKKNIGSYSIQLISTWSNCLKNWWQNLCQSPQNIQLSQWNPVSLNYTLVSPNWIGDMLVQAKICTSKCVYKNAVISVQAWELASFKFISPISDQILPLARGNLLPLIIKWFDSFGNVVGTTIHDFIVSTSNNGWLIYDNQNTQAFEINSFINAGFLYDSFETVGNKETIKIKSATPLTNITQELYLSIVDPIINMTSSTSSFTLPEEAKALDKEQNGISFVDISKLPKLTISINNWQPLYTVIDVKSLWWKFIVWTKINKNQDTQDWIINIQTFQPIDQIITTWWIIELYLYPTMSAGEDTIQVQAGNISKTILINVKPASAKKTVLTLDAQTMDLQWEIRGKLSVTDIWWNLITDTKTVLLWQYGNINIQWVSWLGSNVQVQWEKEIIISPKHPGGQAYLFATLVGVPITQQYPDYQSILVQNKTWPIKNLNVAYVNLYGSDRSQQKDSQSTIKIWPSILSESKKTLAITTQHIGLSDVYKSVFGINQKGQTISLSTKDENLDISISILNNQLGYKTEFWYLPYKPSNQFWLEFTDDLSSVQKNGNNWYIELFDQWVSTLWNITIVWRQLLVGDTAILDLQNGFIDTKLDINYAGKDGIHDVWDLNYDNNKIGQLIQTYIFDSRQSSEIWNSIVDRSRYQLVEQDIGQSNQKWVLIQELSSTLDQFDKSVPSIQHSHNHEYDIGFGDTFKPITNFAQGQSVGIASTPYASEYVINHWDPSYRIGETNKIIDSTNYDWWVGIRIYADPGRIIDQVIDIDRDKWWDKDLLVVYTDGTLRLLVGRWNKQYEKIGDLAYIADGIKKVYVGDGDGDGYQDIFVHTMTNQLRFYKNYDGERIEVDGYPICLDLPWGEQNLDGVYQRFLTDPNNDKITDIVVNDKNNEIRLFLWWWSSVLFELWFGGWNYISRDKFACDPGRKERQEGKVSTIKSFAPKVDSIEIRDESLVHRNWLLTTNNFNSSIPSNVTSADQLDTPDKVTFAPNLSADSDPETMMENLKNEQLAAFDAQDLLNTYVSSLDNTVTLDSTYKPVYENNLTEVLYKQLQSLIDTDKVDGFKKFTDLNGGKLEDWDIVKIDISINPKWASKATYIEKLSWPREIPVSGNKQVGFFAGNLNADHVFTLAPWPSYVFMIDNIALGSSVNFGYHVVYKSQQLMTIKHGEDFIQENGIGWSIGKLFSTKALAQDPSVPARLEITPLDGCAKYKWKILANNIGPILSNSFEEIKIDLQKQIEDAQKKDKMESKQWLWESFNNLIDDTWKWINEEIQSAYLNESWKQKWVLKEDSALQEIEYLANGAEAIGNLSLGLNAHVGVFWSEVDELLDNKIGELTKGLCEWFKVWMKNCSGIPILSDLPFNMAFLAPGDLQVMGCKIWKDPGFPILSFPASFISIAWAPLPTISVVWFNPLALVWAWSPIAQKMVIWVPDPIPNDYVPLPSDDFGYLGWPLAGGSYPSMIRLYLAPTLTAKLGIAVCFGSYGIGAKIPKPFRDIMGNCITFAVDPGIGKCEAVKNPETGKYVVTPEVHQLDGGNVCNDDITIKNSPLKLLETPINDADNFLESVQGEYGIVLKLWGQANLTNYDSLSLSNFFSKVKLEWANPLELKVKWANDKGLVSCIMNQFADNQIRYIINNLTTLNLNIILPDIQWFGNQVDIIWNAFSKAGRDQLKDTDLYRDLEQDNEKILDQNTGSLVSLIKWTQSKQALTKQLDTVLSNPFDKLAVMFNESELIRISSRDVIVEIPRVYTEDIGKLKWIYTSWLARNKVIWKERELSYQDMVKKCDNISDQFDKEKCQNSANKMLQINSQFGQFERSVRQNIETIEMYGQLPNDVYELLHGYDRYIYDVFNFAYGTIDAVTSWLSKVARGFEAWVNFIISLTNIIKSRQVLIDFSVNRKEKCSKCTVDNYSAYSCSFSAFCPQVTSLQYPTIQDSIDHLRLEQSWSENRYSIT
jgi:hypothetical protein